MDTIQCRQNAPLQFLGCVIFVCILTMAMGNSRLSAKDGAADAESEPKILTAAQTKEFIEKKKDIFLLDVRTQEEYNAGHIKGAHLIPVAELDKNIHAIPPDKPIVVYCERGRRSTNACQILKEKGLTDLYNFKGGFQQWKSEGYPVEKP